MKSKHTRKEQNGIDEEKAKKNLNILSRCKIDE